jgi:hypothetical protein
LPDKIDDGRCPALLIAMLAAAIESRANDLSSLDLLERLKTTEKAARWLLDVIDNLQFRALLIDSNEWMENEREGVAFLRDMAARAAQAQERNPPNEGPGRPKTIIPATGWPSALELCALMVGLRWRALHPQWPGKNNPEAQCWCERMWIAAGGAPHGAIARDRALTAWRNHLKTAKRYQPPHPIGERIAHILSGSAPKKRPEPRAGSFRRFYVDPRSRGVPQLPD